jgi:hypothetical protein
MLAAMVDVEATALAVSIVGDAVEGKHRQAEFGVPEGGLEGWDWDAYGRIHVRNLLVLIIVETPPPLAGTAAFDVYSDPFTAIALTHRHLER